MPILSRAWRCLRFQKASRSLSAMERNVLALSSRDELQLEEVARRLELDPADAEAILASALVELDRRL